MAPAGPRAAEIPPTRRWPSSGGRGAMPVQRVDAFRVAFDLEYAERLSDAEWAAVLASNEWHILTAENADLLGPVMARFADRLGATQAQTLPARPIPEGPFSVIGKPAPRLHGFGHVTGFGQYS